MSGDPTIQGKTLFKRVPVIVRSWDGPNSRVGLEMDLGQMPWGPFDALGKRLSLLLPVVDGSPPEETGSESQVERALRHVEHAADRCAEFAQLSNGNQELWLRSQETWEFIRRYLTSLWIETEVDGRSVPIGQPKDSAAPGVTEEPAKASTTPPSLPGAASTLRVAANALKATPLAHWREAVDASDPEAPTREEAIQTLIGVARILGGQVPSESMNEASPPNSDSSSSAQTPTPEPDAAASEAPAPAESREEPASPDPDQLSFEFAQGYDEGYQMGRKVGLALGARRGRGSHAPKS
jgi:hypothetical protein